MIALLALVGIALLVGLWVVIRRRRVDARSQATWRGELEQTASDIESTRTLLLQPAVAAADGALRWQHLSERVDQLVFVLQRLATAAPDTESQAIVLQARDALTSLRGAIETQQQLRAAGTTDSRASAAPEVKTCRSALDASLSQLHELTRR